jgi:hypothetical protein
VRIAPLGRTSKGTPGPGPRSECGVNDVCAVAHMPSSFPEYAPTRHACPMATQRLTSEFPDDFLILIGRLTIVSSTLDNTLARMCSYCEGVAYKQIHQRKDDLKDRIAKACDERLSHGEIDPATATFASDWAKTTVALLGRRDKIVHATWAKDLWTGEISGCHGQNDVPRQEKIANLIDESQLHQMKITTAWSLIFHGMQTK